MRSKFRRPNGKPAPDNTIGYMMTALQLTNKRLDDVNVHLADQSRRIDEANNRLNRLYEIIVRRDEHEGLAQPLARLEQKVEDLAAQRAA